MNIIVTGASKGIGYEAVKLFAASPENKVIAVSRNQQLLKELEKECMGNGLAGTVVTFPFDLVNGDIAGDLVPGITKNVSTIDVLVNNAGILINKSFNELDGDDYDLIFDTNMKAPFLLINALLPFFSESAHIVNIGSMGGFQGSMKFKGLSLYSSSKGALAVMTECLAEELKERKIFVNCLALGSADTEMLTEAFPGYKAPMSAKEMAGFVVDFSLTGFKWFNGKILPVSISTP